MSDTSKPVKRPAKKAAAKSKADLSFGSGPTKPKPPSDPPKPVLIDDTWLEPVWLVRFLYEDGTVEDVAAVTDDSRLREQLLARRKITNDRIVGSARVRCLGYTDLTKLTDPSDWLDPTG